jgi:glycosyltransferase involved in cell wall biosynthesis
MPAISIILCTYNDSHFLRKAIPSCLHQGVDTEMILVDDCSTRPLDEEVKRLISAHGINYIKKAQNAGLAAARNTGIAAAKADLIIPMDADDHFYPNVLGTLVREIHDADVVCGNVTDSGLTHYPTISRVPALTKEHFLQDNPLYCSSLFRKKVWEDVGGYNDKHHTSYEDWNFWAKAFAKGFRLKYVNMTVYHHESRPDGMLRRMHAEREKFVKIATEGVF